MPSPPLLSRRWKYPAWALFFTQPELPADARLRDGISSYVSDVHGSVSSRVKLYVRTLMGLTVTVASKRYDTSTEAYRLLPHRPPSTDSDSDGMRVNMADRLVAPPSAEHVTCVST